MHNVLKKILDAQQGLARAIPNCCGVEFRQRSGLTTIEFTMRSDAAVINLAQAWNQPEPRMAYGSDCRWLRSDCTADRLRVVISGPIAPYKPTSPDESRVDKALDKVNAAARHVGGV